MSFFAKVSERFFLMSGFTKIQIHSLLSDTHCQFAVRKEHDKEPVRTLLKPDRRISRYENIIVMAPVIF